MTLNQIIKTESILLDFDRFRNNLQISESVFDLLKTHNDFSKIVILDDKPSENKKLHLGAILSSLNGMGQLAFTMMIIVRSTGWTPGSLDALKKEEFHVESVIKNPDKLAANACPVEVNNLLELISWVVLEFLIFPCLKIAYADSEFSAIERNLIVKLFSGRWGYNPDFVNKFISLIEPKLDEFSYRRFANNLKEICLVFPEINYEETRDELMSVIRKVIMADDKIHPNEQKQLDDFSNYLTAEDDPGSKPFLINNLWNYIFKSDDNDKNIRSIDILKKIPLFEHLTKREIKVVSKMLYHRVYHTGEYFFRKDQPGAAMFIVRKGMVNIVLTNAAEDETLVATLGSGTFFGELALLDNSPRSASAKAAEPTEVIAFFRSEFNKLLKMYPAIGIKVIKKLALIIGQRLKATNEQLSKR
ncbi:cyclic nucleotide-binding domain-containing protein [bacterium]|nr:cyclic nucleotide-binding domain-containing protein [bacterium]